MMRTCCDCKQGLPAEAYYVRSSGELTSYCKACTRKRTSSWRKQHPGEAKDRRLRKTYGISLLQFIALAYHQNERCAICKGQQTAATAHGVFDVDHCHATGAVRGLLCTNCNRLVGEARESVRVLEAARDYVVRTREAV